MLQLYVKCYKIVKSFNYDDIFLKTVRKYSKRRNNPIQIGN